ncbi:MAG: hypothetical protein AAF871_16720 [Pseudomonadota bacterium]
MVLGDAGEARVILARELERFADFIQHPLPPQENVAQVRTKSF